MQETRGSKIEKECQEREGGRKERVLSREKGGFGLESSKRENNETKRKIQRKNKNKRKLECKEKHEEGERGFFSWIWVCLSHPIVGGVKKIEEEGKKKEQKEKENRS